MKPRIRVTSHQMARILERYSGACALCQSLDGPFEFDHIHQRAIGGPDDEDNLRPLCKPCHKRKTAKDAGVRAKIRRIRRKWFGEGKPERVPW